MSDDSQSDAIVDCARYIDGERVEGRIPLAVAGDLARTGEGFVWIGLHEPTDADIADVAAEFELPPLAVEDAVSAHQRPKLEIYDNVLFVVLKPTTFDDGHLRVGEIALFIGDGFVVTVRHGDSEVLHEVRAAVDRAGAAAIGDDGDTAEVGPAVVLYRVMDAVVDGYEETLDALGLAIDDVEGQVFGVDEGDHAPAIYRLKRIVATLKRAVLPLVLPVKKIVDGDVERIPASLLHPFRDVLDHLLRSVETIEAHDRMLFDVLQADVARVGVRQTEISLRQNEDNRKISAWAAIGLLPTAVAGVYGMNFEHMPELHWRYSYYVVLVLTALGCYLLYRNFRRRGWL